MPRQYPRAVLTGHRRPVHKSGQIALTLTPARPDTSAHEPSGAGPRPAGPGGACEPLQLRHDWSTEEIEALIQRSQAQAIREIFITHQEMLADPDLGDEVELIEPLPGNTSIASFLEKNPAGGQHHMCYEVPDIHAAKAWFESQGKRVLGEPRIGAHGTLIFFVHPKDMGGILTEIMETPKEAH